MVSYATFRHMSDFVVAPVDSTFVYDVVRNDAAECAGAR